MKALSRLKKIRSLETPLPGLTRKRPRDDAGGPGQHGRARRRKRSEYARQLREKQKIRLNYQISERQMRKYFDRANKAQGVTSEVLFSLLERRLSNVVFRLGFAPTGPAARQLVSHGHVLVDGLRVDRAGYLVESGQTVTLRPKSYENVHVAMAIEKGPEITLPSYLMLTTDGKTGRMQGPVLRSDVPFIVDETAVVEFYAR